MSKQVQVIRHVGFEDLGSFREVLIKYGYSISYFEAGYDDIASLIGTPADLLIVLGGPIGVNQQEEFPFIKDELAVIRRQIQANSPVLGICLGSQLLATALGGEVRANHQLEIGWSELKIMDIVDAAYFRHLENVKVLHWHQDTFSLPPKAKLHASTAICSNQAFSVANKFVGLQFHPEVTSRGLERWYIGNSHEIANTPGLKVTKLREESKLYAAKLEQAAKKFFSEWLTMIGNKSDRLL